MAIFCSQLHVPVQYRNIFIFIIRFFFSCLSTTTNTHAYAFKSLVFFSASRFDCFACVFTHEICANINNVKFVKYSNRKMAFMNVCRERNKSFKNNLILKHSHGTYSIYSCKVLKLQFISLFARFAKRRNEIGKLLIVQFYLPTFSSFHFSFGFVEIEISEWFYFYRYIQR